MDLKVGLRSEASYPFREGIRGHITESPLSQAFLRKRLAKAMVNQDTEKPRGFPLPYHLVTEQAPWWFGKLFRPQCGPECRVVSGGGVQRSPLPD